MSYCQSGEKPRLEYSFNGQKRIFNSGISPIDIVTGFETVGAYENYDPRGFTIVLNDGSGIPVINFRLINNGQRIQYWSCGNNDWDNRQPDGTYPVAYEVPEISHMDYSRGCPGILPTSDKCYIKVLNSNGNQIFKDRGDCPVSFNVICGDCPEGQCKCATTNYPGYCCLPCSQVASEIASITAIARSKK